MTSPPPIGFTDEPVKEHTEEAIQMQPLHSGPSDGSNFNTGCPPGLEYLLQVNQLLIKQKMELFEALTGFETCNKYAVLNTMGQPVYMAAEKSDCCTRNLCGKNRPFEMKIVDNQGHEVMRLDRPLRCSANCFPCCGQEVKIFAPPGNPIGRVRQGCGWCGPRFTISDHNGDDQLRIAGPCFVCDWCFDVNFRVYAVGHDTEIGRVSKQWSGLVKEAFTDADNFGISFPMDLDVRMKACLLGAVFLIDFMYFEENQDKDK